MYEEPKTGHAHWPRILLWEDADKGPRWELLPKAKWCKVNAI